MLRKLAGFAAGALLLSAIAVQAPGQNRTTVAIDYMKAKPGQGAGYVRMEREVFKPMPQERVRLGNLEAWRLYQVQFPAGTEQEYGYVTMLIASDLGKFQSMNEGVDRAKVWSKYKPGEIGRMVSKNREMLRRDFFSVDSATKKWNSHGGKYARVHFIQAEPGKANEHAEAEEKYWLPVHQDLEDKGAFAGWLFGRLRIPLATERPYSAVAINFFDDWSQAENQYEKADPKLWKAREGVMAGLATHSSVQFWRLLAETDPR